MIITHRWRALLAAVAAALPAGTMLVLADTAGARVLLALWAVASVRPAVGSTGSAGAAPADGGRAVASDASMGEALADLAGERRHVVVVPAGAEPLRGELVSVGRDVCTLRLEGRGGVVHLRVDAVAEVLTG